ncbi:ABC transporter related protein [Ancylobacter novellus DSM 506]|uniref:ABC transporter related protein n=1 Tax=Ancylobacter novellus (strain ATCC 8093 / DSM 506 / JCM 20403 / CCM 1077 / IAM 12100 / NBRC 12443 / NCIMB 10456) TaxID=639283 RepID=D7A429_ANCN5|nr:ABC transporter ATP-binding protein [Ancylobacter novellus]ADH87849.1 ABC transporter related protein [Ancylobacter novellus DSM 506]
MARILISGLTKSYTGNGAALSALDLDIKDNQFVTLLGPSGCGKTTTLRLIAGYMTPDAGTIRVGDRVISSAEGVAPPDKRGMGMVFQNYAVWPHKTVYENVVFGLKLRRIPSEEARRRVLETLALVNLTGLENRFPAELSGGQQQRVALARSLVVEPEILLLDEPLSNLDAKLRERMRLELKQLQRRTGITFVYVTHDQAEALALSDQIAVMHGGKLQQYGTPDDVYRRPANKIVADFMGIVNFVPGIARGGETIEIDGVEMRSPHAGGLVPGEPIDVAVRPENVRLSRDGADGKRLTGTITEKTYLGNLIEYWVQLASGAVLRAQTHPLEQFDPGEAVGLVIDAQESSVFPRGEASPSTKH